MYYFIGDGTDIDHSDGLSEICSEVSHSLADDNGQTFSSITSRCFPSTSNTRNGTCYTVRASNQPTNKELPSETEKIYGFSTNVQNQCFLLAWYKTFARIHFFSESLRVYCYYCQESYKSKLAVISTKAEPAFTISGFSNWKKTTISFKEHERSRAHAVA